MFPKDLSPVHLGRSSPNMRRGLVVFLLVNLIIFAFLVRSVSTLIQLLFEDASADAILPADIPAADSPLLDELPHLIPKILHQTYKNESIPEIWKEAQQSCIDLHEDYEYKVRFSERVCAFWERSREQVQLTTRSRNIALDRRPVERIYSQGVQLVSGHVRRLFRANSTGRCDTVLCTGAFWRDLPRS